MTLYIVDLTVPADTAQTSPIEKTVKIEEEVIVKVMVHFPAGCHGYVYTACYYGEEQIFPRPYGSYLHGDAETITWEEYYELPESPCILTIKAWSPGTNYNHTIIWRINALPKWVVFWWLPLQRLLNFLTRAITLFGRGGGK